MWGRYASQRPPVNWVNNDTSVIHSNSFIELTRYLSFVPILILHLYVHLSAASPLIRTSCRVSFGAYNCRLCKCGLSLSHMSNIESWIIWHNKEFGFSSHISPEWREVRKTKLRNQFYFEMYAWNGVDTSAQKSYWSNDRIAWIMYIFRKEFDVTRALFRISSAQRGEHVTNMEFVLCHFGGALRYCWKYNSDFYWEKFSAKRQWFFYLIGGVFSCVAGILCA